MSVCYIRISATTDLPYFLVSLNGITCALKNPFALQSTCPSSEGDTSERKKDIEGDRKSIGLTNSWKEYDFRLCSHEQQAK